MFVKPRGADVYIVRIYAGAYSKLIAIVDHSGRVLVGSKYRLAHDNALIPRPMMHLGRYRASDTPIVGLVRYS